jgi:hypothetical protein
MNILLSLLLVVATVRPETGRFNISQDGKRIGSESFTITAITGGYRAEGEFRLDGDPTPMKSRMELDAQLNPLTYEYEDARGRVRLKVEDPVSEYESVVNGQTFTDNLRFPKGGFILENMFHHYLLLLYKASAGAEEIPVVSPQNKGFGFANVRAKGNRTYELEVKAVKMEATVDADGRLIRLFIPEGKLLVER